MPLLDFHSHKTQLIITAASAALATASLLTIYNEHARRARRRDLEHDVRSSLAASGTTGHLPSLASSSDLRGKGRQPVVEAENEGVQYVYDEDLIKEQLARNYAFFGEESMKKVRGASVVVVGCGGVGSWAAVMLARSYVVLPQDSSRVC